MGMVKEYFNEIIANGRFYKFSAEVRKLNPGISKATLAEMYIKQELGKVEL